MLWQTDFYAGSVSPQGCDQEAYDPYCTFNAHPGEYVELQNGPAASQRHSFPLDAHSTYEWTEYLAAFDGDVKKLQDKDYSVANAEVRFFSKFNIKVDPYAVQSNCSAHMMLPRARQTVHCTVTIITLSTAL